MKIKVLYFGNFRQLTGSKQDVCNIGESSNLGDLVSSLINSYGYEFRNEIDKTPGLRILINGRENMLMGGMEAPLRENDTIVILPPVVGG